MSVEVVSFKADPLIRKKGQAAVITRNAPAPYLYPSVELYPYFNPVDLDFRFQWTEVLKFGIGNAECGIKAKWISDCLLFTTQPVTRNT